MGGVSFHADVYSQTNFSAKHEAVAFTSRQGLILTSAGQQLELQ